MTIDNVDQDTPLDPGVRVSGIGPGIQSAALTTTKPNELILYYENYNPHNLVFTPNDPELWSMTSGFQPDDAGGVPGGFNNYASKESARVQEEAGLTSVGGVSTYTPIFNGNGTWDLIAISVRPAI